MTAMPIKKDKKKQREYKKKLREATKVFNCSFNYNEPPSTNMSKDILGKW